MAFSESYRRQVALLLRTLPFIVPEEEFALKGGTAINLFVRDMPRLSVDIDLTYLPVASRDESLSHIDAAMKRVAKRIETGIAGSKTTYAKLASDDVVTRLAIHTPGAQIKIEVTPVLRGCVYQPALRRVSAIVEETFGFAEVKVVSFPDLYAGKIVAALDRQHPRDLFDVKALLANEGIDDELRKAFIVYLISHNRPMHEVIAGPPKNISALFAGEFEGMTSEPVPLEELKAARVNLINIIIGTMPTEHRQFLIGFEEGKPDWDLLGIPKAAELPAVLWRQRNLNTLAIGPRAELVEKLTAALQG